MTDLNLLPTNELREQEKIYKMYFFVLVFILFIFLCLFLMNQYLLRQKAKLSFCNESIEIKVEVIKKKLNESNENEYKNLVQKINVLSKLKKKVSVESLLKQVSQSIAENITLTVIEKISNIIFLTGSSQSVEEINSFILSLTKNFTHVKLIELKQLNYVDESIHFKILINHLM